MNITHLLTPISADYHGLAASQTEEVDAASSVIFADYRCSLELSIFINQIRKSDVAPVCARIIMKARAHRRVPCFRDSIVTGTCHCRKEQPRKHASGQPWRSARKPTRGRTAFRGGAPLSDK